LKSIKFETRNYNFQSTILSTTYTLHIEEFPAVLLVLHVAEMLEIPDCVIYM